MCQKISIFEGCVHLELWLWGSGAVELWLGSRGAVDLWLWSCGAVELVAVKL